MTSNPLDRATARGGWLAVVVLSVSLLMIGLDNTILNVTLPTLQRELSATSAQLQWIVDAYLLVFAGLLLAAGNLGDRWGRRRILQIGIAVFGAGSALAALSSTAETLIASRAVMGVGGALIMPSTLSIITNIFEGPRRARAIAVWTAVAGMGIALGPVTGGWLLERYWWGSIFLVNVPIAVITLAAGRFLVPESRDPAAGRPDPVGVLLSISGLLALMYAVIEAPAKGWTNPITLTAFGTAAGVLATFVVWELHTKDPMLQLRLFRNRRFSAASATIALAFFALFGALFFLTQYLQLVLGYTAFQAGARTVPVAAGLIVGAGLSAPLTAKLGTKLTVTGGMLLAAAGLTVLSTTATTSSGYRPVLAALLLAGLGIGIGMAPATDSVMGALPLAKASVGSAMNDTARLVGGAFGVAVLGTTISQSYRDHITATANQLPPAAAPARDSLQAALHIAQQLPGPRGQALATAAQDAFTTAMSSAALVAAAVALVAAAAALTLLPTRPRPAPRQPAAQSGAAITLERSIR